MADIKQLPLDFSNVGYRRFIIERAKLVVWTITEGRDTKLVTRRVQAAHQKLVLMAINSFGLDCYASVESLAERASLPSRDCERAIKALREQMILAIEKETEKGHWPHNVYCIDFQALQSPIRAQNHAQPSAQPSAHMGGQSIKYLSIEETPPPLALRSGNAIPSDRPMPNATSEDGWSEVEESLLSLGVLKAAEATQAARQRGCSLEHCSELIAHYRKQLVGNQHGWRVPSYVLFRRMLIASPNIAIGDGWFGATIVAHQKPKFDFERVRGREFLRLKNERLAAKRGELLTLEDLESINSEAERMAERHNGKV